MSYIDFGELPALGYKAFPQSFASKTRTLNGSLILPAAEHPLLLLRSLTSTVCRTDLTHSSENIVKE